MRISAVPALNSDKTSFSISYYNDGVLNPDAPIHDELAAVKVENKNIKVANTDKKGIMDIIKDNVVIVAAVGGFILLLCCLCCVCFFMNRAKK